jgi:peptide/nickel transport system substrate-binding protein
MRGGDKRFRRNCRNVSRRDVLKTLGIVGVAGPQIASTAGLARASKLDGMLVWATDRDVPIADPYYLNIRELVIIGHHVWDTLTVIDPTTSEIKPLLATSWKWLNDTTLELELRKGVKFHSGKEMDASDVAYTLNHVSNKANAISSYALMAWISSAEKIDNHKLIVNLHKPFAPALAHLAGLGFILQNGHYDSAPVKTDGKKDFGVVKPNGTGPYKITAVRPGEQILMERHTDYFKGGLKGDPSIKTIKFRTIKDGSVRAAELMTGAIDWTWEMPKDQAERLAANPALKVGSAETLRFNYLQFDVHGTSGQRFFKDRRVRQAVVHAIDRDAIASNLIGVGSIVPNAACHPGQFACDNDVAKYEYNPDKAKKLLADAGLPNGFQCDLYAYRERDLIEAIIGYLAKVGITANLNHMQYVAYVENVRKGRAPLANGAWGSYSIPDVSAATAHFFTGGPDDLAKDDEVTRVIGEADGVTDPLRRKALWGKALARIASEAYFVPVCTYTKYYAHTKDLDYTPTSDEIPQFYAAKWK